MSTVFVLKPIIDVLYNEVSEYKKEIERLNKIIEELRGSKTHKKVEKVEVEVKKNEIIDLSESDEEFDDEKYAKQAEAPPASSPASDRDQVENQKNIIESSTSNNEDVKNVKMIGGKDKKEYMKEYQRTYRKKQKELRAES
jgi:hypothetical protein